jgi:leucyl aminopeptidase (aminopeptidase T)
MDRDIIEKIVKASGVSAGELVLVHFWGEDEDKSIANGFITAVVTLGATPFLLQQARSVNRDLFLAADEGCFDERYFSILSAFDAVIDVFAYRPVVLGCEIEEAKFNLYRKYMAQLFSVLMKSKRFTQVRLPTAGNAEESGLTAADYIVRMTRAYDIDYGALHASCMKERDRLSGTKQLTLHTGEGHRLFFTLSGRKWHIDAGNGDLPCGEVYIAPVEAETHGEVYFNKLYIEDLDAFGSVTLYIEGGRVCGSNDPRVTAFFKGLPEENTVVCELGFGMNPNVTEMCGYTVLDEKMVGTFHIAVGANSMFGGENTASMHMDFVGTGRAEL